MDILTILIFPIHEQGYLSIYLYHIQFPSSVSYSFQSTGLSPPWLSLFLGILFFLMQLQMGLSFFLFLILLVYRKTTDLYTNLVSFNFTECIY